MCLKRLKLCLAHRSQYVCVYFYCYYFEWEKDGNVSMSVEEMMRFGPNQPWCVCVYVSMYVCV